MGEQSDRDAAGECKTSENSGGARKARVPRAILEMEAEALMRDMIHRAKAGDRVVLRLGLEFLSKRIERPIDFELPPIEKPSDAITALSLIANGVGRGELTARQADTLVSLVETWLKAIDVFNFDARLAALEERADHEKTA